MFFFVPLHQTTHYFLLNPCRPNGFRCWVDKDPKKKNAKGVPYMVYCGEWLQNWNGTIEKIRLKDDFCGSVGKGKVLFRALDGKLMMSVHSHEKINGRTHRVPHLFPVDDTGDKIKVITEPEKLEAYLMVYHKDQDHGLHMAYSEDGYTYK